MCRNVSTWSSLEDAPLLFRQASCICWETLCKEWNATNTWAYSSRSWSAHITSTCSKAKQILGLLYRCYYGSASSATLKQMYLSMVRPHLDYAWDPHLAKDKKKLEDVQRFACRLASHQWDASYQDLLQLYELPTLEERRLHLKLGLMFKIINNLCYYPDTPSFRDTFHSI